MHRTTAALIVAAAATTACAQLTLIDLPTGYEFFWATHVSADGRSVAFDLLRDDVTGMDGFVWSSGGWESVPGAGNWNSMLGLSGGGSARLVRSSTSGGQGVLMHTLGGVQSVVADIPTLRGAALSSDGLNVFYADEAESQPGRTEILHWNGGAVASLGVLPQVYASVERMLTTSTGSLILTAHHPRQNGFSTSGRTLILNDGAYTEVGLVVSGTNVRSEAVATSADGSIIVGMQTADLFEPTEQQAAWIHRDGVTSVLTVPGLSNITVFDISADASAILANGVDDDGVRHHLLLHEDGGATDLTQLFLDTGHTITETQFLNFTLLSDDGMTVVGTITDHLGQVAFTLRVPSPGPIATLGVFGLMGVRRRR